LQVTEARLLAYGNYGLAIFHFVVNIAYLVMEVITAIVWGTAWQSCNDVEGNPCNDKRWCGVPANALKSATCPKNYCLPVNATNQCRTIPVVDLCTNVTATVTNWFPSVTQDELSPDEQFEASFVLSVVMFALGFFLICYLNINPVTSIMSGRKKDGASSGRPQQQQQQEYNNLPQTDASYGKIN
jgi:hypothetical protein